MEAGKILFKFSRQTQKNLVGSSKYAYFSTFFCVMLVLFNCHLLTPVLYRLLRSCATISSRHVFLGLTKLSQMRCKYCFKRVILQIPIKN
jgi:hypothetical protein